MPKIKVQKSSQRIDLFLSEELGVTRNHVQKLIAQKKVFVNSGLVKASAIIKENDIIEYTDIVDNKDIKKDNIPLSIVYEDDYLLAVNKPSGLVVHPAPGNYDKTLVNALMFHFDKLSSINGSLRPGIVHRLDKDTSGLLIIAKDDKTHALLANDLKEHKIKRIYVALVQGIIKNSGGTIDAPIGRDDANRQKFTVTSKNSKEAVTDFKVLKRSVDTTLIECELKTGRTHQIRVHLKYIGHPVVGDPLYGKKLNTFGQYLHAKKLIFKHPITSKQITLECDLPKEFQSIISEKDGQS